MREAEDEGLRDGDVAAGWGDAVEGAGVFGADGGPDGDAIAVDEDVFAVVSGAGEVFVEGDRDGDLTGDVDGVGQAGEVHAEVRVMQRSRRD